MSINTVLFDMGGTLEDIYYDDEMRIEASEQLLDYMKDRGIALDISGKEFFEILKERSSEYAKWGRETLIEAPGYEIWSKWKLRDFNINKEVLSEISEDLSVFWETKFYKRTMRKEAPEILESLKSKGYKLGIISNTSSATQVVSTLKYYGIEEYFQCFVLSSTHGFRKPKTSIFEEALRMMNARADESAYVGDTVSRDVIGSKAAGFAAAIQIKSFLTIMNDTDAETEKADFVIGNLNEISGILDRINRSEEGTR